MALVIEVRKITPRRYVGVRRVVKHDGLGPAADEILPRLGRWLSEKGILPDGPPAMIYHSLNRATGNFDIQPAFFVSSPVEGEADIEIGETAGGEALFATHVGPYGSLGETWSAVFDRAAELHRPVTKSSWEIYIDDPDKTPLAALRTQIFVPIDG